jgi:N-hydroxyarylamine O-acetyltransferase
MTDARLAAYLKRIALDAPPPATADGLNAMLAAHRQTIAFENLDVRLGRAIRIDSHSVFDKLVTRRRGGYCFEQNRLFADMMAQLGFPVRPLLARVRLGVLPDAVPVRSHVLLLTELAGRPWVVDAGFGGSFVPPMPLRARAVHQTQDSAAHRLRRIGKRGDLAGEWLLERAGPVGATDGRAMPSDDWQPQYSFDLGQVAPDDLEQANHWTSTRPGTRFTTLHIASIASFDGFAAMTDGMLKVYGGGMESAPVLAHSPADYGRMMRDRFFLDFSDEDAADLPLFDELRECGR